MVKQIEKCPRCGNKLYKNGVRTRGDKKYQKYFCKNCKHSPERAMGESVGKTTNNIHGIGLTETQIREKHDNFYKVQKAAEQLKPGLFIEEKDFVASLKLKGSGHKRFTGNDTFDKYKGKVDGKIYWSHPMSIQKMKNDMILD